MNAPVMTDDKDITRRNAEMVARYQRIMDGEPDDRPMDPAAQREARAWLASRLQQARAIRAPEQH